MRQVKTARGAILDMGALSAKNEKAKAVGNILMNARGDRLNSDGTVRMTAEQIARIDQDRKSTPQQTAVSDPKPITPKAAPAPKVEEPEVDLDPTPISRITRTREDGTKYAEIEYEDGSIETIELKEE